MTLFPGSLSGDAVSECLVFGQQWTELVIRAGVDTGTMKVFHRRNLASISDQFHSMTSDENNITRVLNAIGNGQEQASEDLLSLVYEELRRLAAQFFRLQQ